MPKKILLEFLSISIAILIILGTVAGVVPTETFGSEKELGETTYKLIDKPDDISHVESNFEVVEEYGSFLLVETDKAEEQLMNTDGTRVLNSELNKIYLQRETIDVRNRKSLQSNQEAEDGFYLVHAIGPIKPEWNEELASIGEILEYIPENTYLMDLSFEDVENLEEKDFVRWVGEYEIQHRISPRLDDLQGQKDLNLMIYAELEDVLPKLERFGEIDSFYKDQVRITTEVSNVEKIAQIDGVFWIEPSEEIKLLNHDAQWSVQSGETEERPVWERGLTGEGQIVGVADTGVDYSHSAFRDPEDNPIGPEHRKIVNYVEYAGDYDGHGHGTHVSGSIAGNDEIDDNPQPYNGIAKNARLSVYDIGTDSGSLELPSSLSYIFEAAYEDGARIHSNSWGSDESFYTFSAKEVDQFMWENKDMLILFAAGNFGDEENTMASPATAKNILSVGASGNGHRDSSQNDMATFSSRGPTDDGRLKPEVVAPGQGSPGWYGDDDIISAKSDGDPDSDNNEYTDMQGTSMATPIVAGSAALVREYFEEGYYHGEDIENPSAALIKAMLVNSAEEITGSGAYTNGDRYPNFDQGFGKVTLENSLEFAGDQRNLRVFDEIIGLQTGESDSYTIQVEDSSEPLEITMAYTDYPGSTTAEKALVNDLNLRVTAPDGSVYKGNVFEGTDPGQSTTGGEFDNVNPLESVLRIEPQVGEYEIEVIGANVPQERQPYALAITGRIDYEEETGPISADFDHDPVFPTEKDTVQFIDQSTSTEGDIVEWSWEFGDGATSEEKDPTHVYDKYGYYDVTLTVVDDTGLEDTEERTLKIEEREYCEIKGDSTYEYITNVMFNGIDRDSGNDGGYADHTDSVSDPVTPGETYELSITMSTSGFSNYATVVFDWSQDYKLSNEEVIEVGYGNDDPQTVSTDITVPKDAESGETRMRVMQKYNGYHYDPCEDQNFGENEDYTVKVEETETEPEGPDAYFTFNPDNPKEDEEIEFTDHSTDSDGEIVEWSWSFGDGATSEEQNPTHAYNEGGSYTVELMVIDDNDLSDSVDKEITVEELEDPIAKFDFYPQEPVEDEIVEFTDHSTETDGEILEWSWDFGDGTTSEEQNPIHAYAEYGIYIVELTVTDENDLSDSIDKEVIVEKLEEPIAEFCYSPEVPVEDEIVEFTDQSTETDGEILEWSWSFGDGSTSEEQNPIHAYTEPGSYTVELTVIDDNDLTDSKEMKITVEELEEPSAEFDFSPKEPVEDETIEFIDKSNSPDGDIVEWSWSFGDGATSDEQNPTHTYAEHGIYTIELTVVDDNELSDSVDKEIIVEELEEPIADFSYSPEVPVEDEVVEFTDQSTETDGEIIKWSWDFGDGSISEEQNPSHIYTEPGNYMVELTVIDGNDLTDSTEKEIIVEELEEPIADFSYSPEVPVEGEVVEFTDQSTETDGEIVKWSWSFGEGSTSEEKNPSHTYAETGSYTVELTVIDDNDLSDSTEVEITVEELEEPIADFCYSPEKPVEGEVVGFIDQSTETDGEIVDWSWYFDDGTTSEEQNPSHAYQEEGTYTVELIVTDENGLSDSISSEIIVEQEEDEEEGEYCIISGDTTFEHITNVKFNGIDRDSGDDGGYADHTDSVSDPVTPGESYELSVTMSTGGFSNYATVVFDWSQDYDLSNEEVIEVGYGNDDPQTVTVDITVPEDAEPGETRMRVMQKYNGYHYDPCEDQNWGENEDYTVKVEEDDTEPEGPDAYFTFNPDNPKEDEEIGFTDESTASDGEIVEWSWSFGDGTTSEEQNPSHAYQEEGTYTVELIVKDENGLSDAITSKIIVEQEENEEEGEYCIISGDTTYEYITNVKFNGIDRDSGDDGGYADHTDSVSDPVTPGESYELSVTMSTSGFSNYVTVVIDWSQDYDLSNEEVIEVGYGNDDPQTVTVDITVPEDAEPGETRMRVMQRYNGYHYDPCEDQNFGENEDYTIEIGEENTQSKEKPLFFPFEMSFLGIFFLGLLLRMPGIQKTQ